MEEGINVLGYDRSFSRKGAKESIFAPLRETILWLGWRGFVGAALAVEDGGWQPFGHGFTIGGA